MSNPECALHTLFPYGASLGVSQTNNTIPFHVIANHQLAAAFQAYGNIEPTEICLYNPNSLTDYRFSLLIGNLSPL